MNTFTYALCVVASIMYVMSEAPPQQRSADWMAAMDECKTSSKATDADIATVNNKQIPKTREAACFLACMKKKNGGITADNKMNLTIALDSLAPLKESNKEQYEKFVQIFKDCKALETTEKDECVAAMNIAKCIIPKRDAMMKP